MFCRYSEIRDAIITTFFLPEEARYHEPWIKIDLFANKAAILYLLDVRSIMVRDRAVNISNSGSGGLGFKPRPPRCFLRQGTLYSSLSLFTRVYNWAPATYCWGRGGGSNPAMDFHPIQNATELNWKEAPSM